MWNHLLQYQLIVRICQGFCEPLQCGQCGGITEKTVLIEIGGVEERVDSGLEGGADVGE